MKNSYRVQYDDDTTETIDKDKMKEEVDAYKKVYPNYVVPSAKTSSTSVRGKRKAADSTNRKKAKAKAKAKLLFSMRQLRKLTKKEWKEIGEKYKNGGVHMYRGKRTYFYNGEKLFGETEEDNEPPNEYLVYNKEERETWEVIIILPGVEIIPKYTFSSCYNVETVIMSDTVKRIEANAFKYCSKLVYVKLSANLEYIGRWAFNCCGFLTSIFIPPSCREIDDMAFNFCERLIIVNVPETTELNDNVIRGTALYETSPFEIDKYVWMYSNSEEVNAWVKDMNGNNEEYALHRACSAFNPISDIIYEIIKRQGLVSFQKKNRIGITPLRYLEENPYANINQQKLVKRYILEMMGER